MFTIVMLYAGSYRVTTDYAISMFIASDLMWLSSGQSCGLELSTNLVGGLKSLDINVNSSQAAWAYT